ncbi:proton channel OtopLc isoform X8 [Bacillus rossius redtenbacheri]|uniref:proton channel OtopLc isoform X8 n=1 Tax=Bacillus rossius redtenbacheri TaxID=93214 RepID=UPI002FDD4799
MQRCPYIHEMKERLLSQGSNPEQLLDSLDDMEKEALEIHEDPAVGTVVKLNPDGYSSHTSPAHRFAAHHDLLGDHCPPKNAKTSLFIIMSFIYAKLLVVICIAYVISEVVVARNIPLHYYEGFFTYLYGMSILFLLYVFCFLLQESACCAGGSPEPPVNHKKKDKKDKSKKKESEAKKLPEPQSAGKGTMFQGVLRNLRSSKDVNLNDGGGDSPTQEKLTGACEAQEAVELESGASRYARKRKTSQNIHSHGSFFLRVGAIAFGLGTMIYNGLECGAFFEVPFDSPCYQILRGINPVLQMVFTFMQMYFIFMNSRLNIHRFKVLARFGLMHIVATNLCVWIRTLVLESLKEVMSYKTRSSEDYYASNETFSLLDAVPREALTANLSALASDTCDRVNIMGTIVQDSAPYLFPFIIEYSLIGAAVIYVMWKHIGCNPRYGGEDDLEHRLEVMLSRRAVAMAHAQHGHVDCVGASKGLFFGLLLLVGSLICLILFFVLIPHPTLGMLAIYLADVSHCVLMTLSIVAIIIGFIRVQNLKFRAEEQSDLNDILLRVSAFGLFVYSVFSVIAGSLAAFTHKPNLLVMVTGLLSVLQVVLQLLFIADIARRRVHLPEHDRTKPGRQVVTFLLICNVTMWIIYTFEMQKVMANPVQLDFYGFLAWAIIQRVTLPLCIFHRFHSAVTLAEIWKTSYKARLE